MSKSPNFEGWVGIALGAWLFASPWVLGFSHQAVPTVDVLLIGTILVVGAFLDLIVHGKTYLRGARGGHCKTDRTGRGGDEPEPLSGLS